MLRINLLPPYIYEGAKRRNVAILWVVLLLALIGGFLFYRMQLDAEANRINEEMLANQQRANDADRAKQDADRITAESAEVRAKADFVRGVREYNTTTYQPVMNNIAQWTIRDVLYDGATPSGQTVTLPAYAPSLATIGHYILNMQRNPQVSNVHIALNSIPAFPVPAGSGVMANAGATGARPLSGVGHNFSATLTLVKPIGSAPTYPSAGGGGQAPAGGMGGAPGPMGMGGAPGPMGMGAAPGPMGMGGGRGAGPMAAPPGPPATGGAASGGSPRAGGRAPGME